LLPNEIDRHADPTHGGKFDGFSRAFFQAGKAILSGLFGGKGFLAFCGNGGGAVSCAKLKRKLLDGTTKPKSSLLFSR